MNFIEKWLDKRNLNKLIKQEHKLNSRNIPTKIVELQHGESVLLSYPKDMNKTLVIITLSSVLKGKIYESPILTTVIEDNMHIGDIRNLRHDSINRGYGTVLVSAVIKVAKERGLQSITGQMCWDNIEQYNRQVHFYRKFGFKIDDEHNIKLNLSE